MSRQHIAFFSNTYRPVISGVVRSMSNFRRALTDLGHNVFIFAQHASDYEDKEPFVFRYPALDLPLQDFPVTIPVSNFIDSLLPPLKLDIIHAHHPILLGQVAARKAEELQVPLVFTHHTRYREYSHYVSLPQNLVKHAIDRWIGDYMEQCHHIVVPSSSIRTMLAETYGIVDRVTVVPTGIDLTPFTTADGTAVRRQHGWEHKKLLIGVGRLAEEKNWRTLLSAMPTVVQQHPEAHLVILGDGPDRRELVAHRDKLGLAQQVEFAGAVPFDQIPAYLKAADLFCFASVTETQGLATLEAIAAGLPVVAVDGTGTREVINDGKEGLLTANDSEALAAAINRVLDNDDLRRYFAAATVPRAQKFDHHRQSERLLQVYTQAEADRKAGHRVVADRGKPIFQTNWRDLLRTAG